MNKTVIFSGKMSYIVFSPYWYLPTSIINKEVKPGMAKNKNYLAQHNMEWNNGNVRQKPGKRNSLGLVKFIFPNSNSIYLHDTPSKSLFENETRAYSHGCVRVGKPRDLAINILKEDKNWTPAKIDAAMNAGKENPYVLKKKIYSEDKFKESIFIIISNFEKNLKLKLPYIDIRRIFNARNDIYHKAEYRTHTTCKELKDVALSCLRSICCIRVNVAASSPASYTLLTILQC